ncbi:pyridoxal-phosphate dependent enzyme [Pontibacillus yanchengensis]|uniref:threonine ammonia-lyase n=1 Tax=Pontibacillus yanchengensis TaxID=462910 RepID=A0A6I4ZXX5_9BACI|nr:threonine/serine dehydratase [Pontibacillus yanchengensis]MYL34948.1 pyridoxal-phosphate dependent enzyme [Pontibacillus yanchengensis]
MVYTQSQHVRQESMQPTQRDIWQAKQRIATFITNTPILRTDVLSKQSGTNAYLKLENLQQTGAFKLRGAANKILSLSEEDRQKGVTTFSTGNHGLAVAYVAKQLGIPVVVCISNRVPTNKVNKIREMGAEISIVGESQDEAQEYCYTLQETKGMTVVKPFDDKEVIAGQGTIALELLESIPEMDTCIIPLSGGGLFSGIALGLKVADPSIRIIGVSMEHSAVMYESIQAGKPIVLEEQDTIADSLLGGIGDNNTYTFSMVKQYVDEIVLLSEKEIAQGMSYIWHQHQLGVEGAAATPVSVLLHAKAKQVGHHTVNIITGNNVDPTRFLEAVKSGDDYDG